MKALDLLHHVDSARAPIPAGRYRVHVALSGLYFPSVADRERVLALPIYRLGYLPNEEGFRQFEESSLDVHAQQDAEHAANGDGTTVIEDEFNDGRVNLIRV
jgi:hypothetical protein